MAFKTRNRHAMYLTFSIVALLMTLTAFIVASHAFNPDVDSARLASIKGDLTQTNYTFALEMKNHDLLIDDLNSYSLFYNQTYEDFRSLVDTDGSDQYDILLLQNELDSLNSQNDDLSSQLVNLEAQLK